VTVAWS